MSQNISQASTSGLALSMIKGGPCNNCWGSFQAVGTRAFLVTYTNEIFEFDDSKSGLGGDSKRDQQETN